MLRALLISVLVSFYGNAQNYITIQDARFAQFLAEKYPSSVVGNQLNIGSPEIQNEKILSLNGLQISSLEELPYFLNLEALECVENNLSKLPELPSHLVRLDCSMNHLKNLPTLPSTLEELSCAVNQLTTLPKLPASLKILYCNFNLLTSLPVLPVNLEYLACGSNVINCLPELPTSIFIGDIALNPLTCVSSHQTWMDDESLKLPVCSNDVFNNPNKCICITVSLVDKEEVSFFDEFDLNTTIVSISPNPTKGNITISADQAIEKICVKNIEGQIVIDNTITQQNESGTSKMDVDLSHLINGIYFIQSTVGSKTSIYKVVKSN